MRLFLISIFLLQSFNLLFQFLVVAAGLFQILKLLIPIRNGLFQSLVFLVDLVKSGFGDIVSIKGIHYFLCLFLCQTHCNQIFFIHVCTILSFPLFTVGDEPRMNLVLYRLQCKKGEEKAPARVLHYLTHSWEIIESPFLSKCESQ